MALNDDALRSLVMQDDTTAGNQITHAKNLVSSAIFEVVPLDALCLMATKETIDATQLITSAKRFAATLDASQFANSMASCLTRFTSATANNAMSIVASTDVDTDARSRITFMRIQNFLLAIAKSKAFRCLNILFDPLTCAIDLIDVLMNARAQECARFESKRSNLESRRECSKANEIDSHTNWFERLLESREHAASRYQQDALITRVIIATLSIPM